MPGLVQRFMSQDLDEGRVEGQAGMTAGGRLLWNISLSNSNVLRIWDLEQAFTVFRLGVKLAREGPCLPFPQGCFLGPGLPELRVPV